MTASIAEPAGAVALLEVAGSGVASDYAAKLLASLGVRVRSVPGAADPHPALAWARSGAMALSGRPEEPPRLAPAPLASAAQGALRALALASGAPGLHELDGAALLGERAATHGLWRAGAVSPGGSCRLLRAADRWIAINLARDEDRALLPAWLGPGRLVDPWAFAASRVARLPALEVVERARLLGLAAAVAEDPPAVAPPWFRLAASGPTRMRVESELPRVVDLSSLWAGPLCAHLLGLAGACLIKVESTRRPDGARRGPGAFYDLLNGAKRSVALDFRDERDLARLRALLRCADVVVESARPRALAQLGIDAAELVAERPGLTWVSLTGYGRREPGASWVAFGDDAAVASGLAVASGDPDAPLFCGDAIADPLAGLHAALAAWVSFAQGGGRLIDVSLRDVTGHVLGFPADLAARRVSEGAGRWRVEVAGGSEGVAAPRARSAPQAARPLGADTRAVLAELGIPC